MRAFAAPSTFLDLPFGEQLMLWGIRLWMRGFHDASPDQTILRTGFKLAGVPDAHSVLDGLMTVITTAATDTIDIRCPDCPDISVDEHLLMDVIAGLQSPGSGGSTLFACRLPPTARRAGMELAGHLAALFSGAGLWIRPRQRVRNPGTPTIH
ncbi:MAG: hypothetical protein CMM77_00685 [Rhodospirillaceae bacterium]|nr:hypothetical protein [Magnetovibrio sp.]MAY65623.1 hypothetical protein [Rhodospirillaceae bacterium]